MRFLVIGRRLLVAASVLTGASAFLPQAAEARTNYALIVGVTHYPNVEGADLIGPRNDALLVRDYLVSGAPVPFEAKNVTVLAEDVEGGAGSPTHAAITGALAGIAAAAQPGDFVYVQLSGHGMQQPAVDPASEPDGMDEVFLPADISRWTDPRKGVPQAFTDNEIGRSLDAIRQKGAFVWIVIDACHSGTATRAVGMGGENVVERKIDPKLVGIPDSAFEAAEAAARAASADAAAPEAGERALMLHANGKQGDAPEGARPTGTTGLRPGGMVAFFAAQTVETTPEMPLPRGEKEARRYGLFTYTLMSLLAENPAISYRQLGQSVLQAYAADNRSRPTPLFEGNLDAPVFGTQSGDYVRQWKVEVGPAGITVGAGRLQGLAAGARLAILSSPGAGIEAALGYLEVRSAETLSARAVTVEAEGKPALAPSAIPDNAYARLTQVAFDTELTVSRPAPGERYAAETAEVDKLLEEIADDKARPLKLKFVDAREPADIKLAVMSEADVAVLVADAGLGAAAAAVGARAAIDNAPRLWFLPPTAEVSLATGRRPPSISFAGSTPDGLENEVADNLQRIFRATNLARLAAASDFRPEEFSASFRIRRGGGEAAEPLEPGTMPRVHPGDQVDLVAGNGSNKPVDINVLYIGSDYSISHMYAERLHGGSEVNLPLLEFNADSFGVERMVVVLSEAKPQSALQDLSFLAQEGVREATRSAGHPDGFAGLLRDIGTAPATRGAMRLGKSSAAKGAVLIYPLENLPEG